MEQTEIKINEPVVTGRKFIKSADSVIKDWTRISGWFELIDTSEEELVYIIPEIVKGRTFPNCNHKGRIAEFRKQNKPFHKATLISEDN